VYRGPEGYVRFLEAFVGEFDDVHVKTLESIEANDQVPVSVPLRGRGTQSGAEATWSFWLLWTVRDGKVVRGRGFTGRSEALEATGRRGSRGEPRHTFLAHLHDQRRQRQILENGERLLAGLALRAA
jgi:hypothetical protein